VLSLPSYSPELNPDEFMNGDLKMKMSTSGVARGGEHLKNEVVSHLRSIQSQTHRIRSCFRSKRVAMLPDCSQLAVGVIAPMWRISMT
jgi:hypothetical protein